MDAFQDLFNSASSETCWSGQGPGQGPGGSGHETDEEVAVVDRKGVEGVVATSCGEGDVTSADSTTPPPSTPLSNDGDKLAKNANSIRGILDFCQKFAPFLLSITFN